MLLIGHMARTFGPKMIDSLDNPPSFTKTTFRVLELMESYFKYLMTYKIFSYRAQKILRKELERCL